MYCPRCGEDVGESDRYCGSCGATLPRRRTDEGEPAPKRSIGERLRGLVGRSRRERLLTVGTGVAILIAVGAFIALDPADEDPTANLPLEQAALIDEACVAAKGQIAAAAGRAARRSGDLEYYSRQTLVALVEFRSRVRSLGLAVTDGLDEALLAAVIDAGSLARTAREAPGETLGAVRRLDADTTLIETELAALGLANCPGLRLAPAPADE